MNVHLIIKVQTFPVSPGAGCNVTEAGAFGGNWN